MRSLLKAQWVALTLGGALCVACVATVAYGEIGRRTDLAEFATSLSHPPDQSSWSAARIRAFSVSKFLELSPPIGVLRIPSLELTVPVYPSSSEPYLNRGVGLIDRMAKLDTGGNVGIAGHRDGFFRALKDIATGVIVEVQTRAGVHRYRIISIDIVDAADGRLLADTPEPSLTLVTCYPFYYVGSAPQRFIARGAYLDSPRVHPPVIH